MIKPNIPADFVMIDIETLALHPNAVVTQIGIVRCDALEGSILSLGCVNLSIDQQLLMGRRIESAALVWTLQKGNHDTVQHVTESLTTTLLPFIQQIGQYETVMSNGAGFDLPILRGLLQDLSMPTPWDFRKEFCYRTLMRLVDPGIYNERAKERCKYDHSALNDAIYQGYKAIGAYRVANGLPYAEIAILKPPAAPGELAELLKLQPEGY